MTAKTKKPVAKKTTAKKPATKKVATNTEVETPVIETPQAIEPEVVKTPEPTPNGEAESVKSNVRVGNVSVGQKQCDLIVTQITAIAKEIDSLKHEVTPNHDNLEAIEEAIECLTDTKGELSTLKFKA